MKVAKFGGSSVADAKHILKVIEVAQADPDRRIVVVSAPGKRFREDVKVTDLLIACADAMLERGEAGKELAAVVARFEDIREGLELPAEVTDEIEADLRARFDTDRGDRASFTDRLKAAGEDNCARIVAAAFRAKGVDAQYVNPGEAGLLLSAEPGNAQVLDASYARLAKLRDRKGISVFPGFFGYTESGDVVTFPRGGSDITGAILAAAVKADVYENFTDVDSVYAIDPRVAPDAPSIELLTYREMRELAYAGFGVFHDEAIVPVVKARVPICIRNMKNPDAPGTMIVPERPYSPSGVVGISSCDGFSMIYLSKYLMNREIGFGRRLLQILEEEGLSFEHAPSGIDNTSVIIRSEQFSREKEKHVLARIAGELAPDDVAVEHGLALVMVVGEGMRYGVGLAAKATHALAEAGVNIEMMNQGSSEISMMFGVKDVDREKAVKALYGAFFET